jgi:hypothetical protein
MDQQGHKTGETPAAASSALRRIWSKPRFLRSPASDSEFNFPNGGVDLCGLS